MARRRLSVWGRFPALSPRFPPYGARTFGRARRATRAGGSDHQQPQRHRSSLCAAAGHPTGLTSKEPEVVDGRFPDIRPRSGSSQHFRATPRPRIRRNMARKSRSMWRKRIQRIFPQGAEAPLHRSAKCGLEVEKKRSSRPAFKKTADPTLGRIDVRAYVDPALDAFPFWFPHLVPTRFVLVAVGSLLVVILLATPLANAHSIESRSCPQRSERAITWTSTLEALRISRLTKDPRSSSCHRDRSDSPTTICVTPCR